MYANHVADTHKDFAKIGNRCFLVFLLLATAFPEQLRTNSSLSPSLSPLEAHTFYLCSFLPILLKRAKEKHIQAILLVSSGVLGCPRGASAASDTASQRQWESLRASCVPEGGDLFGCSGTEVGQSHFFLKACRIFSSSSQQLRSINLFFSSLFSYFKVVSVPTSDSLESKKPAREERIFYMSDSGRSTYTRFATVFY